MTKKKPASDVYSAWPHRWAVLLVCVTFPLIWVGGLVTTYHAGMAVPDWPTTYGYNLFLYPWTTWINGPFELFIEHGHRLLGSVAGLITIGLVVSVCFQEQRRWVRGLAVGALLLVIAQGVLGGARVLLNERTLAMIHGCVGPAYFAYCVALAVVTSRFWRNVSLQPAERDMRLPRISLITAALVYLQLVLGANLRHMAADASPNFFRIIVLFHVGVALIVFGHSYALAWRSWRRPVSAVIRTPATAIAFLSTIQIGLGISVWLLKYGWPLGLNESYQFAATTIVSGSTAQALTINSHVVLGSLILALSVMCAVRSWRFFHSANNSVSRQNESVLAVAWKWEAAR